MQAPVDRPTFFPSPRSEALPKVRRRAVSCPFLRCPSTTLRTDFRPKLGGAGMETDLQLRSWARHCSHVATRAAPCESKLVNLKAPNETPQNRRGRAGFFCHKRTRPYTSRTDGKAERLIQTSLREWALLSLTRPPPSGPNRSSSGCKLQYHPHPQRHQTHDALRKTEQPSWIRHLGAGSGAANLSSGE
jgi:hypothetical protein